MIIIYESALDYLLRMQEQAALSGREIKYVVVSEKELGELYNIHGPFIAKDGIYGKLFGTLLVNSAYHLAQLKNKD